MPYLPQERLLDPVAEFAWPLRARVSPGPRPSDAQFVESGLAALAVLLRPVIEPHGIFGAVVSNELQHLLAEQGDQLPYSVAN